MAIRKDGSQLNPADERNTGVSRQDEAAGTNRINEEDDVDTQTVANTQEEGDEDYDDEELEEEDFDVDEEEEDDEESDDEKEV